MSEIQSRAHDKTIRPIPTDEGGEATRTNNTRELVALVCGIIGVIAAVWAYWMIVPGVLLGLVAIVLGFLTRRSGRGEGGSIAIALGVTAILLVPSVLIIVDAAESWGRDCALNPTHDPNC